MRSLTADQKALVGVLSIFFALCIFRAYHLYVTSFFVSDEYRYTRDAMSGTFVEGGVATRFVFTSMNAFLFQMFQIRTTDAFVIFLPFYLFSWISVSIFFFYKMMKLFEFDSKTISLSLLSSLVLVSFTLLSMGFLSESFALAMATMGTYYLLSYVKKGGTLISALASILAFAFASFSREPYYLFLVCGVIVMIMATLTKNRTMPQVGMPLALSSIPTMVKLFALGLTLGFGISLLFVSCGFIILSIKALRKKDIMHSSLLFMCLMALGSYASVTALAATGGIIGDYLSFEHFSTLIRFTDTAIPAFFIAAPFAFSHVTKHKKLLYLSIVSFLLFGVGSIDVYQSYASSNLALQQNPFSLSYRSGGAMVRDYIVATPQAAPFHIVGFWMATWYETTGTSQVDNTTLDFWMNMTQEQFIQKHWTTFYIYGNNKKNPGEPAQTVDVGSSSVMMSALAYFPFSNFTNFPLSPYATQYQISHYTGPKYPFKVVDRVMVANMTAFLIKFDIQWK